MPRFTNKATGESVEFTGPAADWAVSSGQYAPENGLVETSLEGARVLLPPEAGELRSGSTGGNLGPGEQLQEEQTAFGEHLFGGVGQEVLTGLEGVASGLTLGGSDALLNLLGSETRERAQVNPNIRTGGQIVGGLAPAFVGGLALTPAGLAMGAGRAVEGAIGGITGAAVGAATEGAIFGAGQGVGNLVITNEPLTASSVVQEVGLNALLGAGLGAALGGGLAAVGKVGKSAATTLKRADEALGGEVGATAKEAANRAEDIVDKLPGGKIKTALDLDSDLGQALSSKTALNTREFSSAADELFAVAKHGRPVTLDEFATTVRSLADDVDAAAFGNKAFISDLWEKSQKSGTVPTMSLDDFKRNLVDANRDGYLTLSRADLVGAMDEKLVAASDTAAPDGFAHWNFVEKGAAAKNTSKSKQLAGEVDDLVEDRGLVAQNREAFRSAWGLKQSDMLTPAALKRFANSSPSEAFAALSAFDNYSTSLQELAKKVPGGAESLLPKLTLNLDELKNVTSAALPETSADVVGTQLLATLGVAAGIDGVLPEFDGPFDDLLKLYLAHKIAKRGLGALGRDLGKHPIPTVAPDSAKPKPGGLLHKLAKGKFPEFATRTAKLFGHRHGRSLAGGEGTMAVAGGAAGSVAGSMAMRGLAKVIFGPEKLAGTAGSVLARLEKLTKSAAGGTQFAGRHGTIAALPILNQISFGTGRTGETLQDAFKLRAQEITTMYTNPTQTMETVHNALEGVRGAHMGVGDKLEMWALQAIEYLYNALPKDPGNMHVMGVSTWSPDDLVVSEFASRAWGCDAPVDVMEATMRGLIDPFAVEAVRTVHPAIFEEVQRLVLEDIDRIAAESTFDERIALGQLLGIPTDSSLDAEYVQFIQTSWSEREAAAEQAAGSGGGSSGGAPLVDMTQSQRLQQ